MARAFRESKFRSHKEVGEDVNPAAYIVNLADCMLVLACGFMVALMAYWNINPGIVQDVDKDTLKDVTDSVDESSIVGTGNSSYVEAGKAYQDPKTGKVYIISEQNLQESGDEASSSDADAGSSSGDAGSSGSSGQ